MGVRVEHDADAVRVTLSGWDRLVNGRRDVRFERRTIRTATVAGRSELESQIDHRVLGLGAHDGSKRAGRRRVGSMMGRGVIGRQFWAAPTGAPDTDLLVLELVDHEFARAVIEVDRPESVAATLSRGRLADADDDEARLPDPEASKPPDHHSVVLRPSWLASIAIGPLVFLFLVPLALVFDDSLVQALVYSIVFGLVFALVDHGRRIELTPAEATAHDVWRRRSIARTEVRSVARGQWWSGGIRLSTTGKDFWLRVGDQPFGRVSDHRLAVVADWASNANPIE